MTRRRRIKPVPDERYEVAAVGEGQAYSFKRVFGEREGVFLNRVLVADIQPYAAADTEGGDDLFRVRQFYPRSMQEYRRCLADGMTAAKGLAVAMVEETRETQDRAADA